MSRELRLPPTKNVLIVDSDLNLRLSIAMILKRAGYMVTTVGKSCEALDRLEGGNYHLVIIDVANMENKLTLLPTVLRQYLGTSVLVFSAQWSPETAVEIEAMGVSAHMEIPVTPDSLLACVNSILN